jgi:hypothetical protein
MDFSSSKQKSVILGDFDDLQVNRKNVYKQNYFGINCKREEVSFSQLEKMMKKYFFCQNSEEQRFFVLPLRQIAEENGPQKFFFLECNRFFDGSEDEKMHEMLYSNRRSRLYLDIDISLNEIQNENEAITYIHDLILDIVCVLIHLQQI